MMAVARVVGRSNPVGSVPRAIGQDIYPTPAGTLIGAMLGGLLGDETPTAFPAFDSDARWTGIPGAFAALVRPFIASYAIWEVVAFHLIVGAMAIVASIALIRPVYRWRNSPGRSVRLVRAGSPLAARWSRLTHRPCGADAMAWKERRGWRSASSWRLAGKALMAFSTILLLAWTFELLRTPILLWLSGDTSQGNRAFLAGELRPIIVGLASFWLLGLVLVASTGVTDEREQDTWDSLLASPLTGFEILRGKAIGAAWTILPLGLGPPILGLLGVGCGAFRPLGLVALAFAMASLGGAALAVGLWISLRSRSSTRALTASAIAVASALVLAVFMGRWLEPAGPNMPQSAAALPPAIIGHSLVWPALFADDEAADRQTADFGLEMGRQRLWMARSFLIGTSTCLFYALVAVILVRSSLRRLDCVERMSAAGQEPKPRPAPMAELSRG